ncbi:hypothetical protein HY468_02305 [Candidatus Roizmanbacteria bacterium]|nr:hypothetical protein [Candidatus Roizmanbacteria bacterium]
MRKKIVFSVTVLITVALGLLQLIVSHKLSTEGIEVKQMEQEKTRLLVENEELERKIASASSFLTVSQKAEALGFHDATYLYLERPPLALK